MPLSDNSSSTENLGKQDLFIKTQDDATEYTKNFITNIRKEGINEREFKRAYVDYWLDKKNLPNNFTNIKKELLRLKDEEKNALYEETLNFINKNVYCLACKLLSITMRYRLKKLNIIAEVTQLEYCHTGVMLGSIMFDPGSQWQNNHFSS